MEILAKEDVEETQNVFNKIINGELQKHTDGYNYVPLNLRWADIGFIELLLSFLLEKENNVTKEHTYIGFYTPLIDRDAAEYIKRGLELTIPCELRRRHRDPVVTKDGKRLHIYCGPSKCLRGSITPTLLFAYYCFDDNKKWKPDAYLAVWKLQQNGNEKNKLIVFTPT